MLITNKCFNCLDRMSRCRPKTEIRAKLGHRGNMHKEHCLALYFLLDVRLNARTLADMAKTRS